MQKDNTSNSNAALIEELKNEPELISITGQSYKLDTWLSRAFFPPAEENGSSLHCITYLTEIDGLAIPPSFQLNRVYIIKEQEIFTQELEPENSNKDYVLSGKYFGDRNGDLILKWKLFVNLKIPPLNPLIKF